MPLTPAWKARTHTFHGRQSPLSWHAAEAVGAAILEAKPRAGDEILHGAGHEDLARLRRGRDPGADVDGDPAQLVGHDLALAPV
jgi:hypothetical protein